MLFEKLPSSNEPHLITSVLLSQKCSNVNNLARPAKSLRTTAIMIDTSVNR